MEFVAILAGAVIFCILYPLAGTYRKYEASKELRKKLQALNFVTTHELICPAAELYIDAENKNWFVRRDLTNSTPDIRDASEIDFFDIRENGNLILTAYSGKPFSTAFFADIEHNPIIPPTGKCNEFYIRIKTRGEKEENIFISLLNSNVQRTSPEYRTALNNARNTVTALSGFLNSPIVRKDK